MGREGDWEEEKQGLRKEDKATVRPRRTRTRQGGDSGRGDRETCQLPQKSLFA